MLAQCCIDHTAVEKYFGLVRNVIEYPQCFFEFIIIIMSKSCDPCLDLLKHRVVSQIFVCFVLFCQHTCFNDIVMVPEKEI